VGCPISSAAKGAPESMSRFVCMRHGFHLGVVSVLVEDHDGAAAAFDASAASASAAWGTRVRCRSWDLSKGGATMWCSMPRTLREVLGR